MFGTLVVLSAIVLTWTFRQAYAVSRLKRGVGDTWFLAANGSRWFRLDEHRHDVPLSQIPDDLQHAFVAVEDHRFFRHPGVDPIALGRAVVRNVSEAGTVEGGSTLTQQLARTLFLSNTKSYGRKIREAGLALMIDAQLTKEQVLELYLNRIYLSARRVRRGDHVAPLVRQAGASVVASRERSHRRTGARAVRALAVVQP